MQLTGEAVLTKPFIKQIVSKGFKQILKAPKKTQTCCFQQYGPNKACCSERDYRAEAGHTGQPGPEKHHISRVTANQGLPWPGLCIPPPPP